MTATAAPVPPATAIGLSDLGYRVGDAVLLDGIDLEVRAGEMTVIVGPNGAGKSTLLRVMAGDLEPTSGRVLLGGEDVARLEPDALALRRAVFAPGGERDIAFSVGDVVAMGRYPHRRDPDNSAERDAAAVEAATGHTDVSHLVERTVATLSTGEQTRVALARVFAQDTPTILLDEPTTALDVGHEERVMAETRRLADEGRTVVVVLHDLNAAARWADRMVVLAAGRLLADGPPSSVLDAGLLSTVYGHPMRVVPHPFLDRPLVLPERPSIWQDGGR